ncbi:hypothetical protein GCM10027051_17290 [Niabella terrae]
MQFKDIKSSPYEREAMEKGYAPYNSTKKFLPVVAIMERHFLDHGEQRPDTGNGNGDE